MRRDIIATNAAEVIEADAFGRFLEEGVTNRRTAESFRREILEKGATDEPDELYRLAQRP